MKKKDQERILSAIEYYYEILDCLDLSMVTLHSLRLPYPEVQRFIQNQDNAYYHRRALEQVTASIKELRKLANKEESDFPIYHESGIHCLEEIQKILKKKQALKKEGK